MARLDIEPVLQFEGTYAKGAFLDLNMNESSSLEDVLSLTFQFLVFKMEFLNNKRESGDKSFKIKW